MPDAWLVANLSSLFSGLQTDLNELIALANQGNVAAQKTLAAIQSKISAVQATLSLASALNTQLASTGFYEIVLTPGPGDWSSRLNSAANAPPHGGSYFTTGFCCIFEAPNLPLVAAKFSDMIAILTTPLPNL